MWSSLYIISEVSYHWPCHGLSDITAIKTLHGHNVGGQIALNTTPITEDFRQDRNHTDTLNPQLGQWARNLTGKIQKHTNRKTLKLKIHLHRLTKTASANKLVTLSLSEVWSYQPNGKSVACYVNTEQLVQVHKKRPLIQHKTTQCYVRAAASPWLSEGRSNAASFVLNWIKI